MIEFNKEELPDTHERVDHDLLNEDEKNTVHTWHIYLNGQQSVGREAHEVLDNVFNKDLAKTLIPEKATINMVSFYFEGSLEETLVAAEVMCDKLNAFKGTEEKWETDNSSIMIADPDPIQTNDGP